MSFSVFTSIMTYKKNNLGLRISKAEIYFANVFFLKMQGKQVQKEKKESKQPILGVHQS